METYEFEGKTDEDAILNACSQLNLTREEMDIEIVEPGSAGIFGLVGGRKAKIRVVVPGEGTDLTEEESEVLVTEDAFRTQEQSESTVPGKEVGAEQENGLAIAKEALENILEKTPMTGKRSFYRPNLVHEIPLGCRELSIKH